MSVGQANAKPLAGPVPVAPGSKNGANQPVVDASKFQGAIHNTKDLSTPPGGSSPGNQGHNASGTQGRSAADGTNTRGGSHGGATSTGKDASRAQARAGGGAADGASSRSNAFGATGPGTDGRPAAARAGGGEAGGANSRFSPFGATGPGTEDRRPAAARAGGGEAGVANSRSSAFGATGPGTDGRPAETRADGGEAGDGRGVVGGTNGRGNDHSAIGTGGHDGVRPEGLGGRADKGRGADASFDRGDAGRRVDGRSGGGNDGQRVEARNDRQGGERGGSGEGGGGDGRRGNEGRTSSGTTVSASESGDPHQAGTDVNGNKFNSTTQGGTGAVDDFDNGPDGVSVTTQRTAINGNGITVDTGEDIQAGRSDVQVTAGGPVTVDGQAVSAGSNTYLGRGAELAVDGSGNATITTRNGTTWTVDQAGGSLTSSVTANANTIQGGQLGLALLGDVDPNDNDFLAGGQNANGGYSPQGFGGPDGGFGNFGLQGFGGPNTGFGNMSPLEFGGANGGFGNFGPQGFGGGFGEDDCGDEGRTGQGITGTATSSGDPHISGQSNVGSTSYTTNAPAGTYNQLISRGIDAQNTTSDYNGSPTVTVTTNESIEAGRSYITDSATNGVSINGRQITQDGTYNLGDGEQAVLSGGTLQIVANGETFNITNNGSYLDENLTTNNYNGSLGGTLGLAMLGDDDPNVYQ